MLQLFSRNPWWPAFLERCHGQRSHSGWHELEWRRASHADRSSPIAELHDSAVGAERVCKRPSDRTKRLPRSNGIVQMAAVYTFSSKEPTITVARVCKAPDYLVPRMSYRPSAIFDPVHGGGAGERRRAFWATQLACWL